jgi:hypothetical protein
MRIGLIQSRGIGDIIIALPIADYFLERGDEVHWPIVEDLVPIFAPVKPEVNFTPVPVDDNVFFETPLAQLNELRCDRIISLYSFLKSNPTACNLTLNASLKFDEYKYAVAGVPFAKKWELRIRRNLKRELDLMQRLNITRPYICVHRKGYQFEANIHLPKELTDQYQIIEISPITDSPFDWIMTLERASKLVLIDGCFSNLVEQLNMTAEKYLFLRSPMAFTPVLKNGWNFQGGA